MYANIVHSVIINKMLLEKPIERLLAAKQQCWVFRAQSFSVVFNELMQAYKGSRMVGRRLKEDSWRQGCAWWRNMDGVHQGWQACIPDQCA